MKKKLSHINENNEVQMVDVSQKEQSIRSATASAMVHLPQEVFMELQSNEFLTKKGSLIHTATIAGIQAAKKTSELIPLCHQIPLSKVSVQIEPQDQSIKILASASCTAKTGVEMEALTAASVAALTIYDMCKALSHDITIDSIQLNSKTGGKSDFKR